MHHAYTILRVYTYTVCTIFDTQQATAVHVHRPRACLIGKFTVGQKKNSGTARFLSTRRQSFLPVDSRFYPSTVDRYAPRIYDLVCLYVYNIYDIRYSAGYSSTCTSVTPLGRSSFASNVSSRTILQARYRSRIIPPAHPGDWPFFCYYRKLPRNIWHTAQSPTQQQYTSSNNTIVVSCGKNACVLLLLLSFSHEVIPLYLVATNAVRVAVLQEQEWS